MSLGQNYPNPFNPVTTLVYELSEDALVSMSVHDLSGRLVKDLISERQSAGHRTIKWDATNNSGQAVSAGVYLYKIQIGDMMQTKKMIFLK
jgi:flagellar hook assembly protein FlgD